MDKCFVIFGKNELINYAKNEGIFDSILTEFLNGKDKIFNFINCADSLEKVLILKSQYIYTSNDRFQFFDILKKHNYDMEIEIKDAIQELGFLLYPNDNKDTIKKLLNSPVIDDISFDGKDTFHIFSEEYGPFSFCLANRYFQNEPTILSYIEKNQMAKECHYHTLFLSKELPNHYAVTSSCDFYFCGKYYHSYTYDSERNKIIDLCYNSIMDKDDYDRLFSPKVVSTILNSDVDYELSIINQKLEGTEFINVVKAELLRIAIYKEYLNSIGYAGNLENAPVVEKIFTKK